MIRKVEKLSAEELNKIKIIIGEAFASNELFHNWGSEDERRDDVMKYMAIYVDYVYKTGELYANEELTGFIGLEDSSHAPVMARIRMILTMMRKINRARIKSFLSFSKQISHSNEQYAKKKHIDILFVCVEKAHQGQGIARELVNYAKCQADKAGIPLLFDTDMKEYAEMYQHLGCQLYNSITADNGVTRYSLCYLPVYNCH